MMLAVTMTSVRATPTQRCFAVCRTTMPASHARPHMGTWAWCQAPHAPAAHHTSAWQRIACVVVVVVVAVVVVCVCVCGDGGQYGSGPTRQPGAACVNWPALCHRWRRGTCATSAEWCCAAVRTTLTRCTGCALTTPNVFLLSAFCARGACCDQSRDGFPCVDIVHVPKRDQEQSALDTLGSLFTSNEIAPARYVTCGVCTTDASKLGWWWCGVPPPSSNALTACTKRRWRGTMRLRPVVAACALRCTRRP